MEPRLSFLLNRSNDFFVVLDRNGNIIHCNEAISMVFGYTVSELKGLNANNFSHPADMARREDLLKTIGINEQISGYESRLKAKSGLYYNTRWSAVLNSDDNLIYGIGCNLTQPLNPNAQGSFADNLHEIIQSFNEGYFVIDKKQHLKTFNPAFQAITGATSSQLQNVKFKSISGLGLDADLMQKFEAAFIKSVFSEIQYYNAQFNRWLRFNIYPRADDVTVFVRDISAIKMQQLILALEKKVLELNTSDAYSLPQTVDEFLKGIEEIFPDMVCSVLEVDEEQERVYHLSAPNLPADYINFINGKQIGPNAGSCGSAVYHRSQVIVNDIETNPLWNDYKQLVLPYGLKACWSTPIMSSHGPQVLAAFAVYYKSKREPKAEELRMIERTTNIVQLLIENKRNQEYVNDKNQRLEEIASISSHELRRPVATILGLVNLFDQNNLNNPLNKEIIAHLNVTAQELDTVIHTIVEKTIYLKSEQ